MSVNRIVLRGKTVTEIYLNIYLEKALFSSAGKR